MVLKGFSYSKLTELQVQGARDRSRRQIESSQLTTRLQKVQRKWKAALQEQDDAGDFSLFLEAISDVYEKELPVREISPIMAARLAELCRQEFNGGQQEKALERLRDDQRKSTYYLCKEIDESEERKNRIKEDLEKKVEATKKEIEVMKRRKEAELSSNLEWKKQELLNIRETIISRIEELEKKNWSQVQEPVLINKCIEGAEWVDIDEDYFPTNGASSGWVLCS
jgi:hypothetical protein